MIGSGDPAIKISVSLLACDFARIGEQVSEAERAGADIIHLDVMDGAFVPNISFGVPVINSVRKVTGLPLQTHLMIQDADRYIEAFRKAGSDQIWVHAEASPHLHRSLQAIHAAGAKAGVALNPHTPLDVLEWVKDDLDAVLIMTVNPGFGGQSFIEAMLPKIRAARAMLGPNVDVAVDGGVDARTAPLVVDAGANVLIAGTAVFSHPGGVAAGIAALR
ncbi:MAG TPA: ribulose-phosphate 3-epimerase [Armatimonadota bacterium]|jgi:ribulose-phosphate 3-epimerase